MAACPQRLSRRWWLGIVCIVCVALIWSASSVLVQAIFVSADFRRPVFLTWVANSLFVITLPLRVLYRAARRRLRRRKVEGDASGEMIAAASEHGGDGAATSTSLPHAWLLRLLDVTPAELRGATRAAVVVTPLWFAANCAYNIGMGLTSVTSSTVISSSSAAFTLLLSVLLLGERADAFKVGGVALCWLGNALTVVSDGSRGGGHAPNATTPAAHEGATTGGGGGGCGGGGTSRRLLAGGSLPAEGVPGDAICLLGACLYALYTVLLRRYHPTDLGLFFGLLGVGTLVLVAPLVATLRAPAHSTAAPLVATLRAPAHSTAAPLAATPRAPAHSASATPPLRCASHSTV